MNRDGGAAERVPPDLEAADYRSLLDSYPGGVWNIDRRYRLGIWNEETARFFRHVYAAEVYRGMPLLEVVEPEAAERWKRRYDQVFAGDGILSSEERLEVDGVYRTFDLQLAPLHRADEIVGVSVISRDVTDRRQEQRRLGEYASRFQYILELTAALGSEVTDLSALYERILDYLGRTIDLVSASVQLLEGDRLRIVAFRGFLEEEVVKELTFPLSDPFPNARVVLERRSITLADIRDYAPHFSEEARRYQSGHIRSWLGVPMIVGETVVGVITVDRSEVDPFSSEEVQLVSTFAAHVAAAINNAQLYRERARAAETREYLLRELHHRVKNNMQLVSSILSLQGRGLADEEAKEILRELQLRVRSLGLVHEALHEAVEVGTIDLAYYVRTVVHSILREYAVESPLDPRFELDGADVGVDVSVPVGLILGEMVLNAVKHAYPDSGGGPLRIALHREGCAVTLTVADEGVGIGGEVDLDAPESFGLRLIAALAEQLNGEAKVDGTGGTSWTVVFSIEPGGCAGEAQL